MTRTVIVYIIEIVGIEFCDIELLVYYKTHFSLMLLNKPRAVQSSGKRLGFVLRDIIGSVPSCACSAGIVTFVNCPVTPFSIDLVGINISIFL